MHLRPHPNRSWTTGSRSDPIPSHYERIRSVNPGIEGNRYNEAVTGSQMRNAPGQAQDAVDRGAEYVTILMGANDLCTDTIRQMTSPRAFASQFERTMTILEAGLPPGSHVFVSSIPNIYQLWSIMHGNLFVRLFWEAADICQSMLDGSNTEADRQRVVRREAELNAILEAVCGRYENCRFDGSATYDFEFTPSMVSGLDYFHPSIEGQAVIADITWEASWWPSPKG